MVHYKTKLINYLSEPSVVCKSTFRNTFFWTLREVKSMFTIVLFILIIYSAVSLKSSLSVDNHLLKNEWSEYQPGYKSTFYFEDMFEKSTKGQYFDLIFSVLGLLYIIIVFIDGTSNVSSRIYDVREYSYLVFTLVLCIYYLSVLRLFLENSKLFKFKNKI